MAGHTYAINGYSNYNDFPAQEGRYAYGPEQHVGWYVVETTIERVRVPASGYTRFGGAPFRNGFHKENMLKYAPKHRHEGYDPLYESDYENSSPPRYHEGGNFMDNFLNKLHIGARPPMKTSDHSGQNNYRHTSPNKYRPTSPDRYRPTSPNRYRPTSPNKYHPTSPNKYRPQSPNKFRPKSPNKYRPTSPNKYRATSPNKYRPASPNKYQPTSPSKHRPTSSTHSPPSKEPHMVKAQTVPGPKKYRPTSPIHDYPSKEENMNRYEDLPDPNKYQHTSPVHNFPSKEGQPSRTQSVSGPNKNHSSSLGAGGRDVRVIDFSSPNNHWQSASPPTTRRALMTPTNDINEALGFLIESANYSPKREGAVGHLSPRAQTIEHGRRYARPAFGSITYRTYLGSDTIDSEEAVRRYNGSYVP